MPARSRRWRVPPPLTRGGEMLEGAEVLSELSGEASVLLWKSLRTVTLWASAPSPEQAELFVPGSRQRRLAEILTASIDPALRPPLETIAALMEGSLGVRRENVALACRQIAQWAGTFGAPSTEIAFVQAAALACPADADLAFQVARLSARRGEIPRAESWFRRTIMLGRQTGNWTAYSRAFLNLGIAAKRRGNLPLARRFDVKALRCANRHALGEIRAMALHELFTVAVECDDASTAQRFAEQAWQAYGAGHRNLPMLAQDICALWMREGQFRRALDVLRSIIPLFNEDTRLLPLTNLARAAGGTGDRDAFAAAWGQAVPLLDTPSASYGLAADPCLALARGATGVAEWEKAAEMAERALTIGTAAGEQKIVFEAESILSFVRSRRPVETAPTRDLHTAENERADCFADEMVETFSALTAV